MSINASIESLLESSPNIKHGRPRITGTGITVHRIVVYHQMGLSPEEIADQYGHINLAQVYAALT